jgi:hypothetical protein
LTRINATRLPYIMAPTPTRDVVKTNVGSLDFNGARHPYCGLLSSMHSVGLYNMDPVLERDIYR